MTKKSFTIADIGTTERSVEKAVAKLRKAKQVIARWGDRYFPLGTAKTKSERKQVLANNGWEEINGRVYPKVVG